MTESFYKFLLRAYPKEFRLEFEAEMLQVFRIQLEHAQLEKRAFLFWVSTVFDCLRGAAREWFFRKDNDMNWLRNLAIFFCIVFAFQSLFFQIGGVYFVNGLIPFDIVMPFGFFDFLYPTVFIVSNYIGFFVIKIGVFLSLPFQKNVLEKWSLVLFLLIFILNQLFSIFRNRVPEITSQDILMWNISSIFEGLGCVFIIFSRVQFRNRKLYFTQLPVISKILIVYFLFHIFMIPIQSWVRSPEHSYSIDFNLGFLDIYFPSIVKIGNSVIYIPNISTFYILVNMFISNMILAFGIWVSKPRQTTQIPKLVSSQT